MEEENALELLQRYRRDRRVLLDYMLSVSVDYVLNCVKKGGMLELSEAIRDYHDNTGLPHMNNTAPNPVFAPSPVVSLASVAKSESFNSTDVQELTGSTEVRELTVDDIEDFEDEDDLEVVDSVRLSRRNPSDAADLVPKLPSFSTGITDDDLRETAYEVLLACAGASGGLIVPSKEKKKDKRSKLMRKLGRSKTDNSVTHSQHSTGLVGLLENMRAQMEIVDFHCVKYNIVQSPLRKSYRVISWDLEVWTCYAKVLFERFGRISEAMDIRTRQGLLNALAGKVGKRMDTLLVPLELLCCISRTEFSDKKAYIRWQKRQLFMLEEGLINHAVVGFGESGHKPSDLRILLAKIEESEFRPSSAGEVQRTECLRSLREIAIPLAERPARGDLTGEVCHWADGYHLNVRLYEKLLLSVFDILDEGKLTEEVEEILELLKSTWRVLGITETIHYTSYASVLIRQYVITQDQGILKHAIVQLKKIPLKEQRGPQERLHLKSLLSKVEGEELPFFQSFLSPVQKWADKQLGDYHLNFAEV
ncbi:PROTEIN UNC-13-like protein [Salix viminalis]|uniref:PROTEIN UNC-13-like protein n=1 Tax=Salix viminalis TaxID=40686 RepID=A0A9Q0TLM7_SALVM|nr:PROTEIN UNC-13-like protein [Salix viminalis]